MQNLLRRYVVNLIDKSVGPEAVSDYRKAKTVYLLRLMLRQRLRAAFLIVAGVLSAGFGLEGFLLPNGYIDGGVTGISLITAKVTGVPLPILIVFINLPFILLGLKQIGRSFALKSITAIGGLALAIAIIPYPVVTTDTLLVAAFGGFFLGAGIGLAIRGGAVLDGTEVLAIYLNRRTGLSIGDVILIFNVIIFSVAAWLLSVEIALYAILTYLAASKTVDFFIEGFEEYIGVTIVSSHHEEIRLMIVNKMMHGVTVFQGLRGHGKRGELMHTEIIYTVITRLEQAKLQHEVERIDANAFIAMHSVKDTRGGIGRRRMVPGH
ncbi:MAG: YitT family protein [Saprospiraceae bacterium]|nr:YitT family protein [Saprospiraceae bacterium]